MNRVLAAWRSVGQESLNLPNFITLLRIGAIPIFLIFLTDARYTDALIVFILAGVTDSLDGALARGAAPVDGRRGRVGRLAVLDEHPGDVRQAGHAHVEDQRAGEARQRRPVE